MNEDVADPATAMPNVQPPRIKAPLSDEDKLQFQEMAMHLLDRTLRDMDEHDAQHRSYRNQDPRLWKELHSGQNYVTYTRCDAVPEAPYVSTDGSRSSTSRPSKDVVLGMGSVNCSLDDLMYGVFMGDSRAMALKSAVVDQNIGKGAVLVKILGPCDADPFRFLGLKWLEVRPPAVPMGKMLVAPRDLVFIGGTGTMVRPGTGEYIGYEVHHSVDHPDFPPVDGLRRTRVVIGSIYRRRLNGTVDLFIKSYSMEADQSKIMGALAISHASKCIERVWTRTPTFSYMKKVRWCMDHRVHGNDKNKILTTRVAGRCVACTDPLARFRVKTQPTCRLCKAPVCSKCKVEERLVDIDQLYRARKLKVCICPPCKSFVQSLSARELASMDMSAQQPTVFDPLTPNTLEVLARDFSLDNSFCTASAESLCVLETPHDDTERTQVLN